jgi:indolepyruvate ferredoxin oxidoreductase beta subunit
MVPEGESDFLVILEETQIDNNIHKLREGGVLITPATVPLDKLAHPKALNTLMLGALAAHFDQPEEKWLEVLKENLPEKVHQLNVDMFRLGKDSK